MGSRGQLMEVWRPKLKQASLLWLHGFTEALSLHRVVIYCLRSRDLAIRTGQCFILNGLIFLGSIFVLKSVIIPTLQWILPDQCPQTVSQEPCSFDGILELYSSLRLGLLQLVYVLWFYPLYIFSFIISSMWYNDIAKYGFLANAKSGNTFTELSSSPKATQTDKPTDLGGVMIGIAEQVYSVLLLNVFFLEFFVTGYIPYIGKMLNFLLLSWMYAYYCFEYKWNFSGLSLDKRLDFFESNWAFFAGFGNPCILAIFFFSPLVSYGVMAILHMQQQDAHIAVSFEIPDYTTDVVATGRSHIKSYQAGSSEMFGSTLPPSKGVVPLHDLPYQRPWNSRHFHTSKHKEQLGFQWLLLGEALEQSPFQWLQSRLKMLINTRVEFVKQRQQGNL